jgi:hypothetical protein
MKPRTTKIMTNTRRSALPRAPVECGARSAKFHSIGPPSAHRCPADTAGKIDTPTRGELKVDWETVGRRGGSNSKDSSPRQIEAGGSRNARGLFGW